MSITYTFNDPERDLIAFVLGVEYKDDEDLVIIQNSKLAVDIKTALSNYKPKDLNEVVYFGHKLPLLPDWLIP
jgi:hypothetical protein